MKVTVTNRSEGNNQPVINPKILNLKGKVFNRLTALSFDHQGRNGLAYWNFKCECGRHKVICGTDVTQGKTKSCGCIHWSSMRKGWLAPGQSALNSLYASYKANAKSRSLEFSIDRENFKIIVDSACEYCGVLPFKVWTGTNKLMKPYTYNGLDRVNNSVGYTKENVVPCCQICNKAKHALSLQDFSQWIKRLVVFQTLKETVKSVGKN